MNAEKETNKTTKEYLTNTDKFEYQEPRSLANTKNKNILSKSNALADSYSPASLNMPTEQVIDDEHLLKASHLKKPTQRTYHILRKQQVGNDLVPSHADCDLRFTVSYKSYVQISIQ